MDDATDRQKLIEATNTLLSAAEEVRRNVRPLVRQQQILSAIAASGLIVSILHVVMSGKYVELLAVPAVALAAMLGYFTRII
jgi:hypothetical protein